MATTQRRPHPGRIEYWQGDEKVSVASVADVPEHDRYAPTPEGDVPVTKVVAHVHGDRRIIRELGPEGQVLRSTVQFAGGER